MLQLHSFTFNPFQENTFIIYNEHRQAWIIDPGMMTTAEEHILDNFIKEQKLSPQAVYLTHAHIDHILGLNYCCKKYNIDFKLHQAEQIILQNAENTANMFGIPFSPISKEGRFFDKDSTLKLGNDTLEIRWVPGHSPGSVLFYNIDTSWAIVGDTLFEQSIGRTDLFMGDYDTLIHSIKQYILSLPDDTIIYPGHGSATTINNEKKNNPFIR